jgi:hypothetical protein
MAFNPYKPRNRSLAARSRAFYHQKNKVTTPTSVTTAQSGKNNITDNLVNEWIFNAGSGDTIYNRASGDQESLVVQDMSKVEWAEDATYLSVSSGARLLCNPVGTNLEAYDRCVATGEISIEAWVAPENITQDGPARIITMAPNNSDDSGEHNFMLGQGMWGDQNKAVFSTRVRTDDDDANGEGPKTEDDSVLAGVKQHVVLTANDNGDDTMTIRSYLSGVENGTPLTVDRDNNASVSSFFENIWDSNQIISVANSTVTERPWAGKLYAIRIYDKALKAYEVSANYTVGIPSTGARPLPKAAFYPSSSVSANALDIAKLDVYVSGVRKTSTEVEFGVSSDSLTEGVDFTVKPADHSLSFAKNTNSKPIRVTLSNPTALTAASSVVVTLSSISTGTIGSPAVGTFTFESARTYPSSVGFRTDDIDLQPESMVKNRLIAVRTSSKYYLPLSANITLSASPTNTGSYTLSSSLGTGTDIQVLIPSGTTKSSLIVSGDSVTGSLVFDPLDSMQLSAVSSTDS